MMKLNTFELRRRAEPSLRSRVGSAYGVLLVKGIILLIAYSLAQQLVAFAGLGSIGVTAVLKELLEFSKLDSAGGVSERQLMQFAKRILPTLPSAIIITVLLNSILKIIFGIFVKAHFELGARRWFSRNREQSFAPSLEILFSLFKRRAYFPALKGMFWKNFILFLWTIPFYLGTVVFPLYTLFSSIIPALLRISNYSNLAARNDLRSSLLLSVVIQGGLSLFALAWLVVIVIKRLQFHFVDWLLADQPELDPQVALKLSREMAVKHKWLICKIHLRYFAYHFLAAFTLIFYFFLKPLINSYKQAVFAELYALRRDQLVAEGKISMADLGYTLVEKPDTEVFSLNSEVH